MVFFGVQCPYTLVSVAPIGNISWLCVPRWESYALGQAERLKSHARAAKVVHSFAWNPLYNKVLHSFALNPLYFASVNRTFYLVYLCIWWLLSKNFAHIFSRKFQVMLWYYYTFVYVLFYTGCLSKSKWGKKIVDELFVSDGTNQYESWIPWNLMYC